MYRHNHYVFNGGTTNSILKHYIQERVIHTSSSSSRPYKNTPTHQSKARCNPCPRRTITQAGLQPTGREIGNTCRRNYVVIDVVVLTVALIAKRCLC